MGRGVDDDNKVKRTEMLSKNNKRTRTTATKSTGDTKNSPTNRPRSGDARRCPRLRWRAGQTKLIFLSPRGMEREKTLKRSNHSSPHPSNPSTLLLLRVWSSSSRSPPLLRLGRNLLAALLFIFSAKKGKNVESLSFCFILLQTGRRRPR